MNDVISSMKLIRESRYIPAEAKREFDAVMPLVERFGKLGPNARRVLLALAERLVVGIPHGDFDKPHDWDKESSEEALDLAVYQAAKLLGLGKAEEPRKHVWGSEFRTIGPDGQQVDSNGRTPDGIERSAWTRTPREELYTFGHEFIHGKKYTRFHEGPSYNPRVTLVDDDGRTPDGKPWVPPAGARVRVVHAWEGGTFHLHGKVGDVFVVREAYLFDEKEARFALVGVPRDGWLLRVVPA